jgi:hypothetical protein
MSFASDVKINKRLKLFINLSWAKDILSADI